MGERKQRPTLNIAGRAARAFLHSKLTPLIAIAITLFGLLAIAVTPRTYNPDIVVPVVNIVVSRPGSNAHEMLNQVVRPLEALVGTLPGVDHTYGVAKDDMASVTVRFQVGQDETNSLVKVYNQINSNLNRIPPGTSPPLIQLLSLYDVPIVTVTLSSHNVAPTSLRQIGVHLLGQLSSISGVGKTWVQGAAQQAIRVKLNTARLAEYRLNPTTVAAAIRGANINKAAGNLVSNAK